MENVLTAMAYCEKNHLTLMQVMKNYFLASDSNGKIHEIRFSDARSIS